MLPEGITLDDFTHIAVWCVPFGVDFGHVELGLPAGYLLRLELARTAEDPLASAAQRNYAQARVVDADGAEWATPLPRYDAKARDPLAELLLSGDVMDGDTVPVHAGTEGLLIGDRLGASHRPKPDDAVVH